MIGRLPPTPPNPLVFCGGSSSRLRTGAGGVFHRSAFPASRCSSPGNPCPYSDWAPDTSIRKPFTLIGHLNLNVYLSRFVHLPLVHPTLSTSNWLLSPFGAFLPRLLDLTRSLLPLLQPTFFIYTLKRQNSPPPGGGVNVDWRDENAPARSDWR